MFHIKILLLIIYFYYVGNIYVGTYRYSVIDYLPNQHLMVIKHYFFNLTYLEINKKNSCSYRMV